MTLDENLSPKEKLHERWFKASSLTMYAMIAAAICMLWKNPLVYVCKETEHMYKSVQAAFSYTTTAPKKYIDTTKVSIDTLTNNNYDLKKK